MVQVTVNNNTIALTEKEVMALDNLILNEYSECNGAAPESYDEVSSVWNDCLDAGPHGRFAENMGGVISSLVKKGLAFASGERDGGTCVTREGFEAWQQLRAASEEQEQEQERSELAVAVERRAESILDRAETIRELGQKLVGTPGAEQLRQLRSLRWFVEQAEEDLRELMRELYSREEQALNVALNGK